MTSDQTPSHSPEQATELNTRRNRWLAWWLRSKVAIPSFLLLLLLASPLLLRGYNLGQVPVAPEPFDTQAVLNFVVPDERNAYIEFCKAGAVHVKLPRGEEENYDNSRNRPWSDVAPSIRQWVTDNQAAIALWNKGAEKPDAQPTRISDQAVDVFSPVYFEALDYRYLIRFEAVQLQAEQGPEDAWRLLRNGLRVGHHITRYATTSELLAGFMIQAAVTQYIVDWTRDSAVTQVVLMQAQKDLDGEPSPASGLAAAFQMDYLVACKTLRRPISNWSSLWLYACGEPELSLRCMNHAYRNYLREVDKPRRERTPQFEPYGFFEPKLMPGIVEPSVAQLDDWIDQTMLIPAIADAVQFGEIIMLAADEAEARRSQLKTVLALEAYRREHERYPESLSQLVPTFMAAIPDDPFALLPAPLRYRSDGTHATIWSIGRNQIDDAGSIDYSQDYGYILGPRETKSGTEPRGETIKNPD